MKRSEHPLTHGRYVNSSACFEIRKTEYCSSFPSLEAADKAVPFRPEDRKFSLSDAPDTDRFITSNDLFFRVSRDRFLGGLSDHSSNMKSLRSVIDEGSTRGTGFIPGYQGYIPTDTQNPLVSSYESQSNQRERKPDRIDTYTGNVPGFTGCRKLRHA